MFEYVKNEQWTSSFLSLWKKTNIESDYLRSAVAQVLHTEGETSVLHAELSKKGLR